MRRNKLWRGAVLLLLGLVFGVSAYQAGTIVIRGQREEAAFTELASQIEACRQEGERQEEGDSKDSKDREISAKESFQSSYAFLKEKNSDFFGWLSIPGTKLDYPVMYTPEEPEYYIHRAFDKTHAQSGAPFVGEGYEEDGGHTIIYGHNMKNGTMFATLLSYADKEFWEKHPTIILETLDSQKTYEVLGAFYSGVYPKAEEDVFRFYQSSDLREPEAFQNYVDQVQQVSLYDTGIEAEYGGELLTLATCSYHRKDGRFVVVAYCGK